MLDLSVSDDEGKLKLTIDGEINGSEVSAYLTGTPASVYKEAVQVIKTHSGIGFGTGKAISSNPVMVEPFQKSNMENPDLLRILLVLKSAVSAGVLKRNEKFAVERLLSKAQIRKLSDNDFTEAYMLSKSENIPSAVHLIAERLLNLYLKQS